jgi:hypothetical protein
MISIYWYIIIQYIFSVNSNTENAFSYGIDSQYMYMKM